MKNVGRFVLFFVAIAFVAGALKLLGWVPRSIEPENIRPYSTLEDVGTDLGIRKIFLPSYFPQYLSWPPSEILAQKRPYPLVLMYFKDISTGAVVLAIRQTEGEDADPVKMRIEPYRVTDRQNVTLKGRKALLLVADCEDGRTCNAVTWKEDGNVITVVARDTVKELLRIAGSMLPEPGNGMPGVK